MVSLQQSNDPLIADAKIFNPEAGKSKSYILRGFHQLYQYTCDYNQSIGYLVIFNTSQTPLRTRTGASRTSGLSSTRTRAQFRVSVTV